MNAIFAVVFIAATVAAQTFDFDRSTTTDLNKILLKSKFQNEDLSIIDLLRTNGLLGNKEFNTRVATPWVLPKTYYNHNQVDTSIYTLDEIIRHPLFRQYLSLPLFRQHLSSPLFQYYLTTPLFQQYWTIPQFQTFFTNPYLFNKYVYPVVFNTHHSTSSSIFNNNMMDTNTMTNTMYPVDRQTMTNTMYPVDRQTMDVDRYLNNGVWDKETLLSQYKNVLPIDTLYNNNKYMNMNTMYPTMYPTMMNRQHHTYTNVMDKLFKNMMINKLNKPALEIVTDVKIMDKKVDGQIVDPIKYTKDYKIVDGQIVPVIADRKMTLDDIIARRPIDRTMVDDLFIRKPTTTMIDDLLVRKPTINMIDELFNGEQFPIEKFNKFNRFNTFEGKNMNMKDAILRRMIMNKMMYGGDNKIDEVFPEYTTEMMKNIPILEKIEKINKLNRMENIEGMDMDKLEKLMMTIPRTTFDEMTMTRTPVVADLYNKYNKDILNNIPMTKEMKDFTYETPMMTQDKIFGDNMYTMTMPIKTMTTVDLEKPTTKTVIV